MALPCDCCNPEQACYAITPAPAAFEADLGALNRAAGPGSSEFTYTNFAGSGVTVVVASNGGNSGGSGGLIGQPTQLATGINVSALTIFHVKVTFSQPVYLRKFGVQDLDSNAIEQAGNFVPQLSGAYGQTVLFPGYHGGCIATDNPANNPLGVLRGTVAGNPVGGAVFPAPLVTTLDFDICRQTGAGQALDLLAFDLTPPQYGRAYRCIDAQSGVVTWYDGGGNLIPTSSVVPCAPGEPVSPLLTVSDLVLTGFFFGDGPDPLGENICAISTPPTSMVGFTAVGGGCFDPPNGGNPTLTWATPLTSLTMEYGNLPHTSGGVIFTLASALHGGTLTWPARGVMTVGQIHTSNPFPGGGYATFTYISGPAGANAPSFAGGANINLHLASTDAVTPAIRYRLDFYA